jgi:type II secretory pathway pseudopilin PulG
MRRDNLFKIESSFTLVELLVVIGILAILTAAVVIVLNPAELLKQSRDSQRTTDLASVSKAIQLLLSQNPSVSLGLASTVYVSLPAANTNCSDLSLPALPAGYSYQCALAASVSSISGSGWIPVDFTATNVQNLPRLPQDPANASSTSLYYTYVANPTKGTFELTSVFESAKYRMGGGSDRASTDGGNSNYLYEKGSDLSLNPVNDAGLVGYWPLDEGSGTSTADVSGNGRNGALTNGTLWKSGTSCKAGSCAYFDGIDDYIAAAPITESPSFTLSIWMMPAADSDAQYGDGVFMADHRIIYGRTDVGQPNDIGGEIVDVGGTGRFLNSTANAAKNAWTNVVLSYSSSDLTSRIYVDGILRNSRSLSVEGGARTASSAIEAGRKSTAYFNGTIDDMRLYNRALSAAEIQAIYNATK